MGILRTNKISGLETPTPVTGSVVFDGSGDYLTAGSSGDYIFGAGDYTLECWAYFGTLNSENSLVSNHNADGNWTWKVVSNKLRIYTGSVDVDGTSTIVTGSWYHFAVTRQSSTLRLFVNGINETTATSTNNYTINNTLHIGAQQNNLSGTYLNGYISNLRILKGTALYTSNFTPPVNELQRIGDTVLLCCNNPDSAGAEETGKTITVNGNAAASTFSPGLTRDFTFGTQFEGVGKFDTFGYFVPPSSTTENRFPNFAGVDAASARGLFGGGYITPAFSNIIDYITISTLGNAADFGDLTAARRASASCSSSTRGVFGGGYSPSILNTIDFVTIASTGNASDFGDLTAAERSAASCSNSTRGLFAGGVLSPGASTNAIDYVTIFSMGLAIDFGDVISAAEGMSGCSSTTRGLIGGGSTPTGSNVIQYVTISTTANALDFGDLTVARWVAASYSNSTRGLWSGGRTPTAQNVIDYVTIASTGNATDFGDLLNAKLEVSGCASSTRGVVAGGFVSPANVNVIEYVTILSTGNSQDFGDLTAARAVSSCSNGHGGLG